MCAVRQFGSKKLQVLCLLFSIMVLARTMVTTTAEDCQEVYSQKASNASRNYEQSYEQCEHASNNTRRSLIFDEQKERAQIEEGARAVCDNLRECESLEKDMEYFKCISDSSNSNLDILLEINFNATNALLRLRDDLDKAEREFMLCTLDAQHAYANNMRLAYNELHVCRQQTLTTMASEPL